MASPRASHFLDSERLLCRSLSHIQTNQSRAHIPSHLFCWAFTLWATILLPSILQDKVSDNLRQLLQPKEWLKLFKLANPKSAYLDSPVPSHRNHNKGSWPCFLLLLLPTNPLWGFSMWPCTVGAPCLLFPGNCHINFSLPDSHFHVCMF